MNISKFAALISYITQLRSNGDIALMEHEIDDIARRISDLVEMPAKASEAEVQELMKEMNNQSGIIPAIKAYRVLTNAGLREAKDAVERYRVRQPVAKAT